MANRINAKLILELKSSGMSESSVIKIAREKGIRTDKSNERLLSCYKLWNKSFFYAVYG